MKTVYLCPKDQMFEITFEYDLEFTIVLSVNFDFITHNRLRVSLLLYHQWQQKTQNSWVRVRWLCY